MSSALYVKVYKFIYKLDMIFLKTKAEGAGICVLQIIYTKPCYFKNSYKKDAFISESF